MSLPIFQRYFVRQLGNRSYRPIPEAEYGVQILGSSGPAERIAYIARDFAEVVAVVHAFTESQINCVTLFSHFLLRCSSWTRHGRLGSTRDIWR